MNINDALTEKLALPHWLWGSLGAICATIFGLGIFYASMGYNSSNLANLTLRVDKISDTQITLKARANNQAKLVNHLAARMDTAYKRQTVDEASLAGIKATLDQINTRLWILVRRDGGSGR